MRGSKWKRARKYKSGNYESFNAQIRRMQAYRARRKNPD